MPFQGQDPVETLSNTLKAEIPWETLPQETPEKFAGFSKSAFGGTSNVAFLTLGPHDWISKGRHPLGVRRSFSSIKPIALVAAKGHPLERAPLHGAWLEGYYCFYLSLIGR